MASQICKVCGSYMSDPCVLMNSLFERKLSLERKHLIESSSKKDLIAINISLTSDLGLKNHEILYLHFKARKHRNINAASEPIVFTLECALGHRREYEIACQ